MKTLKLILLAPAFLGLIACAKSESPFLQTPPEKVEQVTGEVGKTVSIPDPKVNILFVVDNSGSMMPHQELLKRNIEKFASTFFTNPRLDYKIGVVPVYDSFNLHLEGSSDGCAPGKVRKMNPLGELVPLKGAEGKIITRDTPEAAKVLKETVAIGVQCGPDAEESFSPVLAVLDEKRNKELNDHFYDKDAYLVVIFLTDANDLTPGMTANQFYDRLKAAKGGDESKILMAAAIPNSPSCQIDSDPIEIRRLMARANGGSIFNLCSSSFGTDLANFGKKISEDITEQRIEIGFIPDKRLKVYYGVKGMRTEEMQEIPLNKNGQTGGYSYMPNTQMIILSHDLNINRIPGGEIFYVAYPINPKKFTNGLATTEGQD